MKDLGNNQIQTDLQTWPGQEELGFPAIASVKVPGKKINH